jgi:hypothetical protein
MIQKDALFKIKFQANNDRAEVEVNRGAKNEDG